MRPLIEYLTQYVCMCQSVMAVNVLISSQMDYIYYIKSRTVRADFSTIRCACTYYHIAQKNLHWLLIEPHSVLKTSSLVYSSYTVVTKNISELFLNPETVYIYYL